MGGLLGGVASGVGSAIGGLASGIGSMMSGIGTMMSGVMGGASQMIGGGLEKTVMGQWGKSQGIPNSELMLKAPNSPTGPNAVGPTGGKQFQAPAPNATMPGGQGGYVNHLGQVVPKPTNQNTANMLMKAPGGVNQGGAPQGQTSQTQMPSQQGGGQGASPQGGSQAAGQAPPPTPPQDMLQAPQSQQSFMQPAPVPQSQTMKPPGSATGAPGAAPQQSFMQPAPTPFKSHIPPAPSPQMSQGPQGPGSPTGGQDIAGAPQPQGSQPGVMQAPSVKAMTADVAKQQQALTQTPGAQVTANPEVTTPQSLDIQQSNMKFAHGGANNPNEIVFHHTGGGNVSGALNTLQNRSLSYHYVIDRNGQITNLVPPNRKAFHAKGHNNNTIGISFVGGGKFGNVNKVQHGAAANLTKQLIQDHPSLKSFAGHAHRTKAGKMDPSGFDYKSFSQDTGLAFKPDVHGKGIITPKPAQGATPTQPLTPGIGTQGQISQQQQMAMQQQNMANPQAGNLAQQGEYQIMTSLPKDYNARMKGVVDASNHVYGKGTPQSQVAAAQAILESRLHGSPSGLASRHNNLFGIKGSGTAGRVKMGTAEYIKGRRVRMKQGFSKNKTIADSFKQHQSLMNRLKRYKPFREAKTLDEAFNAIHKSGYATDPRYGNKLRSIYNRHLKGYYK